VTLRRSRLRVSTYEQRFFSNQGPKSREAACA